MNPKKFTFKLQKMKSFKKSLSKRSVAFLSFGYPPQLGLEMEADLLAGLGPSRDGKISIWCLLLGSPHQVA
jgi:hypothetical protein